MRKSQALLFAAALACATAAHAQYAWIDAKGVRQYSDQPPPPGTPKANILKWPGYDAPPTQTEAEQAAPTLSERDADYRKRHKELADRAATAAARERIRSQNEAACAAARAARDAIGSGERLHSNRSGDRNAVMDDAEREAALAQANRVLEQCQ